VTTSWWWWWWWWSMWTESSWQHVIIRLRTRRWAVEGSKYPF